MEMFFDAIFETIWLILRTCFAMALFAAFIFSFHTIDEWEEIFENCKEED